jgi:formylglycine-generating enzyme required for sulfatase activity
LARYFLPSNDEWHKAAYYDPIAGVYYDYPTGSDDLPDGIDFLGDPEFEAVFRDPAANAEPNVITNVGRFSPFETAGQGGNVAEWEETSFDLRNTTPTASRGVRGGGWGNISTHLLASNRNGIGPSFEADFFGLRVVHIPEPSALPLLSLGTICLVHRWRRRK